MSARLGLNEIGFQSWKGQTFTQISSKIHKNSIKLNNGSPNIFKSRPLPIYRREISIVYPPHDITNNSSNCFGNARTSLCINQFETPGGTIMYQNNDGNKKGINSVVDGRLIKNQIQKNETFCNKPNYSNCLSSQHNALRRTRSAGVIKRNYYSDTKGYLYSRKQSFDQNQYNFISSGNSNEPVVVYKPNNYNYSQQGAVDSSTRLDRLKYYTLNRTAINSKGVYGSAMADSLAYGVPEIGFNVKNNIGYPMTKTPIVSKYTGVVSNCGFVRVKR